MSRLIDLDQPIFVPITDESQGGVQYEQQMTIEELFQKFFDGNVPEIVDAIPVEWLCNEAKLLTQSEDGFNKYVGEVLIIAVKYWNMKKEDAIWNYIEC